VAKRVQILGHTTSGADAFTGEIRELSVDTTRMELRIHDGITAGGIRQARQDLSNTPAATASVLGHMSAAQVAELTDLRSDLTTTQNELDTAEADLASLTAAVNALGALADLNTVGTAQIDNLAVTAAKLAADAVETAKIKDLNVTSGKLADNAVLTAKVADAQITNAKLANMAAATFKGRNTGTGVPEDLSATTATALLNALVGDAGSGGTKGLAPAPTAGLAALGYVLRADGTWGRPGTVKLAEHTITTALSVLDFIDIPADYSRLILTGENISCSGTAALQFQFSHNNGSSFITSGYDFQTNSAGQTGETYFGFVDAVAATTTLKCWFSIDLHGIVGYKTVKGFSVDSTGATRQFDGVYSGGSLAIVNALRIKFSANNIDAGKFTLWGV
jgi:hypothetical protein